MKRIRYRFKSPEIQVIRVRDILNKSVTKLPRWVQDGLGMRGKRTVLWRTKDKLAYWTNYGCCTLELRPQDYLIRMPIPHAKNQWEITGYLKEKFRKNIERF